MIKIVVEYRESINHYPSYKKIITKVYLFGLRVFMRVQDSDAIFIPKNHTDRRR